MAPAPRIHLDSHVIQSLLKSARMEQIVQGAGRKIANASGRSARVFIYQTDRKAASVTVPAEKQARDGVLTRGAATAGFEVKGT